MEKERKAISIPVGNLEWSELAQCKGQPLEIFFGPSGHESHKQRVAREKLAASICANCPVIIDCREFARDNREYGYWGGESQEARVKARFGPPGTSKKTKSKDNAA